MINKELHNLDHIVSVKLYDKVESNHYVWKVAETTLFNKVTIQREGVYLIGAVHPTEVSNLPEDLILIDKVVYHKPYVRVIMVNPESSVSMKFDDYESANAWFEEFNKEVLSEGRFLKI